MASWLSQVRTMGAGFWAVLALGVAMSAAGGLALRVRDQGERRLAFNVRAAEIQGRVENAFTTPLEFFYATRSFFENSDNVTADEFTRFAGPGVRRNPTLTALEWAPLVRSDQRAAFEVELRTHANDPRAFMWEPTPAGDKAPAAERAQYFPVLFAEPPSPGVLGLDVTFEPKRLATMTAAIRGGTGTASSRIKLAADPQGVFSVFVTMPVFRQSTPLATEEQRASAVRGLCIALFRLDPVFRAALQSIDVGKYGVIVEDSAATGDDRLLFSSVAAKPEGGAFVSDRAMKFHDRTWNVRVWSLPSNLPSSKLPVAVFLAGVVLTLAGAAAWILRTALQAAAQAAEDRAREAKMLGQYKLIRHIASGGMGTVYQAEHALLRRVTAVKVVDGSDPDLMARFEREVRAMSALRHPNTAAIYDFGRSNLGTFFYAMEYIEGLDLERVVRHTGAMPQGRVVHILEQVCASLAEAHEAGLVHRDIKPSNVMITHVAATFDYVKVLDFGLVKDMRGGEDKVSVIGQPIGTAQYLAPEAITTPEQVTPAVDIYSVGALGYFLLTGKDAFGGGTQAEILARHMFSAADAPSTRAPSITPEFDALILRCLEKSPAARFPSAAHLRAALLALPIAPWIDDEAREWWAAHGDPLLKARAAAEGGAPTRPALTFDLAARDERT